MPGRYQPRNPRFIGIQRVSQIVQSVTAEFFHEAVGQLDRDRGLGNDGKGIRSGCIRAIKCWKFPAPGSKVGRFDSAGSRRRFHEASDDQLFPVSNATLDSTGEIGFSSPTRFRRKFNWVLGGFSIDSALSDALPEFDRMNCRKAHQNPGQP